MKFKPKPFVVERKRRSRQKPPEPKSIWADTPGWNPHAFGPTDGSLQQKTVDVALQPIKPAPAVVAACGERILSDRSVRAPGLEAKSVRKPATRRAQPATTSADAIAEALAETDELNVPPLELVDVVKSTAAVAGSSEIAALDTAPRAELPRKPQLSYRTRRRLATEGLPLGQRWKRLLPKAAR